MKNVLNLRLEKLLKMLNIFDLFLDEQHGIH
jgi:hypothetical protein